MGAPVFHYAVKVEELWINGGRYRGRDVPLKPIYAFRLGRDGSAASRELFYDSTRVWDVRGHARIRGEDGRRVVGTSLRTCGPVSVPGAPG